MTNSFYRRMSRGRRLWERSLRLKHRRTWRRERRLFSCTLPVPELSVGMKMALCSPKICGTAKKISCWLSPKGGCAVSVIDRRYCGAGGTQRLSVGQVELFDSGQPRWACVSCGYIHSFSSCCLMWWKLYLEIGPYGRYLLPNCCLQITFPSSFIFPTGFWGWRRFYLLQLW